MTNHSESKNFVVGAVIGALLGTGAALLLAPKSGRKLRDDICETCSDLSESTQDMAECLTKKGKCLAKAINCEKDDLAEKARCIIHEVKNWFGKGKDEDHTARDLTAGVVAGAVIGTLAGLFLAPKSGSEVRQGIVDTYNDLSNRTEKFADRVTKQGRHFARNIEKGANGWLSFAEDLVEQFAGNARETKEDLLEKGREFLSDRKIQNVIDWASLGFRVFQHLKKKG